VITPALILNAQGGENYSTKSMAVLREWNLSGEMHFPTPNRRQTDLQYSQGKQAVKCAMNFAIVVRRLVIHAIEKGAVEAAPTSLSPAQSTERPSIACELADHAAWIAVE
jgi:hypothetical protein